MPLTDQEKLDVLVEQYLAEMEIANEQLARIYTRVREIFEKKQKEAKRNVH